MKSWMWFFNAVLLVGFPIVVHAMPQIGTSNDDSLFFQGTPTNPFSTTLISPSGVSVPVSGNYNVNNTTYDGLGAFDTLFMTNLNDFLQAPAVANIELIIAGGGNDVIDLNGYTDNDLIVLGSGGDDVVFGGSLNDTLLAASDNDFVDGGLGNDFVTGEGGNDTLIASLGNDFLFGGSEFDTILFNPSVTLASLLNVEVVSASTILPTFFGPASANLGFLFTEFTNFNGMTSTFVADQFEAIVLDGTSYSPTAFVSAANGQVPAVPEPSTMLLMGSGLAGLIGWRWRHTTMMSVSITPG